MNTKFQTRQDYEEAFEALIRPLPKYYSEGKARMMPGCTGVSYGEYTAGLEGFSRILWGLVPYWKGGKDSCLDDIVLEGITNGTDPSHPEYWGTYHGVHQAYVEMAAPAYGILLTPEKIWEPLSQKAKENFAAWLYQINDNLIPDNNWRFFRVLVNCALRRVGMRYSSERLEEDLNRIDEFYRGDGWYSDGPNFAFDYYNSFVIHPMYIESLEIITEAGKHKNIWNMPGCDYQKAITRAQRFGMILERLISPEGTLPVVGRSITYRTGSLQTLALLAWRKWLPKELTNGQVRAGMTAVIERMFGNDRNFNEKGFLTLGFNGSQPGISDYYTNNGSLYMASLAFLPLGLPADDPFWTDAAQPWTSKKAWDGDDFPRDHSYHEK